MIGMLRIHYVRWIMKFVHYLSFLPAGSLSALQSRLRAGGTVDQVKQREQEQPHNIDKVPIQPEILNRCNVPGTELSSVGPPCKPEQQANADNHVQRVHAGHREIKEKEDLRLLRHIRRQRLFLQSVRVRVDELAHIK